VPVDVVVRAARVAVTRVAPAELEVFDSVADAWRRGRLTSRRRGTPGGSVGIGIDAVLVGEIALQALSSGLADVFAVGVTTAGAHWWQRWRRSRPTQTPAALDAADDPGPAPATVERGPVTRASPVAVHGDPDGPPLLDLTEAQAQALRVACRQHAVTLGLTEAQAELLADATVGALLGQQLPQ
jgi:hypothetical protein